MLFRYRAELTIISPMTNRFVGRPSVPLLIMGNARTGSNLWRAVLSRHPDVFIAQELQLWTPYRRGFVHWMRQSTDLSDRTSVHAFLDRLYALEPDGRQTFRNAFWKRIKEWVPQQRLAAAFERTDRSEGSFIRTVLQESARHAGCGWFGAKNPAHIAYVSRLRRWLPDARVLHLVRDPRAIYASQVRKKAGDMGIEGLRSNLAYRFAVVLFTTIEWWSAYMMWARLRGHGWYRLCRFEDFVDQPRATLDAVCRFWGIEARPAMLDVSVKASSFESTGERSGVQPATRDRWRRSIAGATDLWFRVTCRPGMKALGYL